MKGQTPLVTIMAITVILLAGMFSYYTFIAPTTATTVIGDPDTGTGVIDICESSTSPTLTVSFIDQYNKGTSVTTNYRYREVGQESWTTGTGTSVSIEGDAGTKFEIWAGVDNVTDNGAYAKKLEYEMPCSETPSKELELYLMGTPSSFTWTWWNADSSVHSNTNNQTLAADSVYTMSFELKGESKKLFGHEDTGNLMVCRYSKTSVDKLTVIDSAGTTLSGTDIPTYMSQVTGFSYKAWEMPSLYSSGITDKYQFEIDTDTSNAVSVSSTPQINCTLYDGQGYLDEEGDNNFVAFGFEDEDDTAVGAPTNLDATIYAK